MTDHNEVLKMLEPRFPNCVPRDPGTKQQMFKLSSGLRDSQPLVVSTTTSLLWVHRWSRIDCTSFLLVTPYLCKAELLAVVIKSKCGVKMNVNENGVFNLIPRWEKSCRVQ